MTAVVQGTTNAGGIFNGTFVLAAVGSGTISYPLIHVDASFQSEAGTITVTTGAATGTVTSAYGVYVGLSLHTNGTATHWRGVQINAPIFNDGGAISPVNGGGTVSDKIAVSIDDYSGGSGDYAIFIVNGKNNFGPGVASIGRIANYNSIATFGNGVASIIAQSLATAQPANFNSGTPLTLFTPTVAAMYRISALVATANTPTGATNPSITIGWTDASGVARTFILIATASTSANTVMNQASMVIYTNNATAVTATWAGYAAGSGTALQYNTALTAEAL